MDKLIKEFCSTKNFDILDNIKNVYRDILIQICIYSISKSKNDVADSILRYYGNKTSIYKCSNKSFIYGLSVIPDFINIEEEKELLNNINKSEWSSVLKRRVQHYGYEYDYKGRGVTKTREIPEFLKKFYPRLQKFTNEKLDQVIVNEYEPGQGIGPHIDNIKYFTNDILGITLGSYTCMTFTYKYKTGKDSFEYEFSTILPRRSLLVMNKFARYIWSHSIKNRKTDDTTKGKLKRGKRISITFRTLK